MAKEIALKYGCNPNQKPSRIYAEDGELPVTVLNGKPGYINFLDALNSWQLVKELNQIVSASLYVFAVFLPVPFVYGFTNPTFPDA